MKQRQTSQSYARVGFTLIELLVVIAIIAILAAILFPVFAAVREQSRQSSTMSNMHSMYVGAKTFNEDEGSFPTALLGYAEVVVPFVDPPQNRPATAEDVDIVPMDQARGSYLLANGTGVGHLYREQVKDYITFTSPANREKNLSKVTQVYYPRGLWPIIDPSAPLTLNENQPGGYPLIFDSVSCANRFLISLNKPV